MTGAAVALTDLNQIVQDVMSSFAGGMTPGPGPERGADRDADTWLEAWVKISGGWDGEVVLAVLGASAPELAGAMLGVPSSEVTTDDSVDALCELVNMIGGQVKGTLPPGSRLSLPLIRMMRRDTAAVLSGGREVASRTFDWCGHPLKVTVREAG